MGDRKRGRAIYRTYLNLRERPVSPSRAIFDATLRAGAAIYIANRIQRSTQISYEQFRILGRMNALTEWELRAALDLLKAAGVVDFSVAPDGSPSMIAEAVAVSAPILEQCDDVWQLAQPLSLERAAVDSAELGATAPLTRSDHCATLEARGHPPELHTRAIQAAAGAGLLYEKESSSLQDTVIFSPYVWKTEALDVAGFLGQLPANERQLMLSVSSRSLDRPGISETELAVSGNLLRGARRVGLIDSTRVQTANADERSFVFSPQVERTFEGYSTEATHDRKLFTSHILYGHRYGNPQTGRIDNPIALVSALINNGEIRPSTAAKTDYLLLEAAGIVEVHERGHLGTLRLIRDDVARDSLTLLRSAVGDPQAAAGTDELWLPGSAFTTPERDRSSLPAIPPSAEREALSSVVDELRAHLAKQLRGEDF